MGGEQMSELRGGSTWVLGREGGMDEAVCV